MRRISLFSRVALIGGLFFSFSSVTHADALGQTVQFKVNSGYDFQDASSIPATLRAMGTSSYLYVDDRFWNALSSSQRIQYSTVLNQLVTRFDQEIYPRETALWGNEARPGVDGDQRVTILFEHMKSGTGGYFESIHSYSVAQAPESNQRDMIYINADSVIPESAHGLIAHEFQHLISFNQKEILRGVSDDTWMNEGRSEFGITESGYSDPYEGSSLQRRVRTFLQTPSDSLVEWLNASTDYAITSLFSHYLADRYGSAILAYTSTSVSTGMQALDEWLSVNGRPERFRDVFGDWMAAVHVNDLSLGTQFGHLRSGLRDIHISPQSVIQVSIGSSVETRVNLVEWQPYWLGLNMPLFGELPPGLMVKMQSASGAWGGSYIATYLDGHQVVGKWKSSNNQASILIATKNNDVALGSVVFTVAHGLTSQVDGRQLSTLPATITAELGEFAAPDVKDGDLIRRPGEAEIYVIWGKYRRFLTTDILKLYGFQDRPVAVVPDEVFHRYTTSNYVRALNEKKVYAVWPDGTKHWLNITASQWDASGRDWGAIFTVNDLEVAHYLTGPDISR